MNCPLCNCQMREATTVKLKGNDRVKVVGKHAYCVSPKCNYEVDLK